MKFQTTDDVRHFLVEIGQLEAALAPDLAVETFEPTAVQLDEFIKRRNRMTPIIKDFRQAQNSRAAWRKSRYKYMKGIRGFHDSTKGKRFHRSLGRFLATRDTTRRRYKREANESLSDVADTLKAISSLRTHLYIWLEAYRPVDEAVDAEELAEEVLPALMRIESALLSPDHEATDEDIDLLAALTEDKALAAELEAAYPGSQVTIDTAGSADPMTETGVYLERLNVLKRALTDAGYSLREALFLSPIGIENGKFYLAVEDKVYAYTPKQQGTAVDAIADEFMQRAGVSRTMALSWLRTVAEEEEVQGASYNQDPTAEDESDDDGAGLAAPDVGGADLAGAGQPVPGGP